MRARVDCGILTVVLCSLGPLPAVAQTDAVASFLENGDFSQGLASWTASDPADWSVENGIARSFRASDPDSSSQLVAESTLSQCVSIEGRTSFRLAGRFSYAAPNDRGFAQIHVTWYFDAACRGAGQFGAWMYPERVSGWQLLSRDDISPALGAKSARVSLVQRATDETWNAGLWDDIELVSAKPESIEAGSPALQALPAGATIARNGSFDEDLGSWRSTGSASWSAGEGAGRRGSARTVMSSTGPGMGGAVLEQCVDVGSNARYSLAASFKADSRSTQKGSARLRLVWYASPGCQGSARIGESADPEPETPGWQRVVVESSARPPNAASALIELIQSVSGPGDFAAFWDDVTLEPR